MNNEPIAWMQTWENQDGELKHTVNIEQIGKNDIPLYTHSTKTPMLVLDGNRVYPTAKTQEPDCYGDGNVYRGVRSKDSEIQTIHIDSTAKTLTDEEYKPLTEADVPYQKVAPKEVADAIDKALRLKTLTDEEIMKCVKQFTYARYYEDFFKFAKKILKKASEK